MGRAAKHNWQKLFLEYNQGRYKNIAEFAKKKDLHPVAVRREFAKLKNSSDEQPKTQQNITKKHNKTQQKNSPDNETKQNKPHPWEHLKNQFLDWPDDKLQAYLEQIESRLAELKAIPDEELTQDDMREIGTLRRDRRAILSDPDPEHICSAHNHDGSQCRNPVERGKRVCWVHGGAPGSGKGRGNLRHGLYAKILPDCDEFKALVDDIDQQKSPIDILWHDIVILQAQIMWAQRIMFVTAKQEMIKELKKVKSQKDVNPRYAQDDPDSEPFAETYREEEWEFQFAWDRQATTLTAQAKAMKTLEGMIQRYEAMASDEQKLKVQKIKQDMEIAKEHLELEKKKAKIDEGGGEKEIYVDTTIPGIDDEGEPDEGDQDD